MAESTRIRFEDARSLLRLVGELAELAPDPMLRGEHLVTRLCTLLKAQCGLLAILEIPDTPTEPRIVSGLEAGHMTAAARRLYQQYVARTYNIDPMVRILPQQVASCPDTQVTFRRREVIANGPWYRSEFVNEVKFPIGADDAIYCMHPVYGRRYVGLGINRQRGDRPFGERERLLLHLVGSELGWFFRWFDSAASDRGVLGLPPRLHEVMQQLLRGASEKEIANRLTLSPHTIHDHVKALYKRFGAASRAELLARFVKKADCLADPPV